MSQALASTSAQFGHVMFPSNIHLPAATLSRLLLQDGGPGSGWATRVFFSDDGSTAMEIAVKMALRLFATRQREGRDSGAEAATTPGDTSI